MLRAVDSSSSNQFLPFFFFFFLLFKKRLLLPERFLINSSFFTSNISFSLDFDRSLLATNYPKDIPVSHYDNISIVHPFSPSYISTKYISDSHRLTIEFELVCNASFPPSKPSKIFQIYVHYIKLQSIVQYMHESPFSSQRIPDSVPASITPRDDRSPNRISSPLLQLPKKFHRDY